jgi:hypothetical protein
MADYPILFGFRDLIAGKGFVAGVALDGRALLVDEGDGFWMYGVNPGGVAAGGDSAAAAQSEFRTRYKFVLFDFAAEAASFEDFRREVERFLNQTNEENEAAWKQAVAGVRSGRVSADWLPRKKAESQIAVHVTLIENPDPSVNEPDEAELAA